MDIGLIGLLRIDPLAFFLLAGSLVGALGLHEYAHALAADLQGDRLPRAMGRLTPNPIRHLDPLGTICILLVGFGWGKPVEFRPQALSSKRFGAAIVALAGPMMNLALALVAAFIFVPLCQNDALCSIAMDEPFSAESPVVKFAGAFMAINLLLAIFNLVPLPPLDGSRLLTIFLPPSKQKVIFFLDRYGFLILLGLVFFGGFTVLEPVILAVEGVLLDIAGG
ncbi:MAG TPA: site-2 protease family protein [Actinomycetota bacterium]|nr:site-2 protease family protein [Actinomycetota bacterium]